jgi:hypothetical protein
MIRFFNKVTLGLYRSVPRFINELRSGRNEMRKLRRTSIMIAKGTDINCSIKTFRIEMCCST